MNPTLKNGLIFLLALVVVGTAFAFVNVGEENERTDIATIAREIQAENVASIIVRGAKVEVTLKDGKKIESYERSGRGTFFDARELWSRSRKSSNRSDRHSGSIWSRVLGEYHPSERPPLPPDLRVDVVLLQTGSGTEQSRYDVWPDQRA
jgi:hypothetical protein